MNKYLPWSVEGSITTYGVQPAGNPEEKEGVGGLTPYYRWQHLYPWRANATNEERGITWLVSVAFTIVNSFLNAGRAKAWNWGGPSSLNRTVYYHPELLEWTTEASVLVSVRLSSDCRYYIPCSNSGPPTFTAPIRFCLRETLACSPMVAFF